MSRCQAEFRLHCAVADTIRQCIAPGVVWFHPANGEYRPGATGARLKRMGVLPGVSDLIFVLPGNKTAFLELKASAKGKLSDTQVAFRDAVTALGCWHEVAHSFDEAIGVLRAWGVIKRVKVAA